MEAFFVVDCFCLKSVAVFAGWVGAWKPISGMEQKGGKIIDWAPDTAAPGVEWSHIHKYELSNNEIWKSKCENDLYQNGIKEATEYFGWGMVI